MANKNIQIFAVLALMVGVIVVGALAITVNFSTGSVVDKGMWDTLSTYGGDDSAFWAAQREGTCLETDSGENREIGGKSTFGGLIMEDVCIGSGLIKEYSCSDINTLKVNEIQCKAGYTCKDKDTSVSENGLPLYPALYNGAACVKWIK